MNQCTKRYKNEAKRLRTANFAIAIWGAIEKCPILLPQYWKNE